MSIKNEHKMMDTRDRVKGVLPAFVMRACLISHPHYVRLCIIVIHCNFSSESYIHIDPDFLVHHPLIFSLLFHVGKLQIQLVLVPDSLLLTLSSLLIR